jgi:hypothetical protein
MTNKTSQTTGNVSGDTNPLGLIINAIPWEYKLLDLEFADTLRDIVNNFDPKLMYSNKYILLMLAALIDAEYLCKLEVPNEYGRIILIKRV